MSSENVVNEYNNEIENLNHVDVNHVDADNSNNNNSNSNPAKEECVELRNIKYKSMLLKKTNTKQLTKCNSNIDIDSFLEKERTQNKEEQWTKLDKSMKILKINAFVEHYSRASENNLNNKDKLFLREFLLHCLEPKKNNKNKRCCL